MSELAENRKKQDLTIWIGVTLILSFLAYAFFYSIAGHIRKLNRIVDPDVLSPPLRAWYLLPRDGAEPWVLYFLVSSIVFFTIIILRYESKWSALKPWLFKVTKFVLLPIGFATLAVRPPPVSNILNSQVSTAFFLCCIAIFWFALLKLYDLNKRAFDIFVFALLVPICFISTGPLSVFDYSFILDPALRLFHGFELHEIYLQYDLLLPLLVLPFLKFGIDTNKIQFLFQLSYYAFFVGSLLVSRKIFFNKALCVSLLVTLSVTRFFAIQYDPTFAFQLTPLRLDLWLIPFFLVWYYGIFSWTVGLSLGVLVLTHRNFGIIYFAAYLACLLTCYLGKLCSSLDNGSVSHKQIALQFVRFLKSSGLAVSIPFLCVFIAMAIFRDVGISQAGRLYGAFGFGFDAINRSSYYWYVLPLISITVILLFKLKREIDEKYFNTGIFLIFLVIGNSLYFFGRSHESNIVAISGSIVFLLYFFIDMLGLYLTVNFGPKYISDAIRKRNIFNYKFAITLAPIFIILVSGYFYSQNISNRLSAKYLNIKNGNFDQLKSSKLDLRELKRLTNSSDKVYAMSFEKEFNLYYDGGYVPPSYWFPYGAWVFKADQVKYLQRLLDDGYYLIYDLGGDNYIEGQREILSALTFGEKFTSGSFGIVHK